MSGLGIAGLSLVAAGALVGALGGDRLMTREARLAHALRLHAEILATIEQEYVDGAAPIVLESSSVRGMLATLDPHSRLLPPGAHDRIREHERGSYDGLGLSAQRVDAGLRVVAIHEGSPAQLLGIRAGDVIARINGRSARGMLLDDASHLLRGPKGSTVGLTIIRNGYDDPLRFTVVRDAVPLRSVPYAFLVTPSIGYVRLIDFKETTACLPVDGPDCAKELELAIERLLHQGATGIVLDLRDNPGGRLEQGFAVANLFLQQGQVIGALRGKDPGSAATYTAQRRSRFTGVPLVVLTSRHSASSSEIVAGAIQDHDRGLIVGERTFGKALVQVSLALPLGYGLVLTTARYYTPSGRSIQRDYRGMAIEDYVQPQDRAACGGLESSSASVTDAGRRVYGGDGIAPDLCVEAAQPPRIVAYLEARGAFLAFSTLFDSAKRQPAGRIGEAGSRTGSTSQRVTRIDESFEVDSVTYEKFIAFLAAHRIDVEPAALARERVAIERRIQEEVLRQVFGEGEARRRTIEWDPQVQRALEVMPDARLLLDDPREYVARGEGEADATR